MRHRTKTETYGSWIKLVKKTNPKTGRKHYSVIADPYLYAGTGWNSGPAYHIVLEELRGSLRNHFDPGGNRGMKGSLSWKFSNKEQAEQLIMLAILKWGERYVA